jgi:hypothetical protein
MPQDPISTPMVERTNRALESFDPFASPIPKPKRLDGAPIVREREPVPVEETDPKSTETPPLIPENASYEAKSDVPQANEPVFHADLEPEKPKRRRKPKQVIQDEPNPIHESRSSDGLPSYRCEFAGRDIFVGWPFYKNTNPVTAATQVAFALDFGRDKIRFDMAIGDAIIGHSRNRLAHKFLETDAKWLIMIDDDIIPSIGRPNWFRYWVQGARNIMDTPLQRHGIHRLIGAGKTLVGGAYFGRQEGGALMCSDNSLYNRAKAYEDAVVPVDWVGTGFMLIHRKVFDDIKQKYDEELKVSVPDYQIDYFRQIDGSKGEDVSFCLRAKSAGHQPHIDLGLPIFHVGVKTY